MPKRIAHNTAHEVDRPTPPLRTPSYWNLGERAALLRVIDERYRFAFDLVLHVGLRSGELYGMPTSAVNWERGLIHITQVCTRKWSKKHPKTKKSHRTVPIPDHLMDPMREILAEFEEPGEDTPLFPAAAPKRSTGGAGKAAATAGVTGYDDFRGVRRDSTKGETPEGAGHGSS